MSKHLLCMACKNRTISSVQKFVLNHLSCMTTQKYCIMRRNTWYSSFFLREKEKKYCSEAHHSESGSSSLMRSLASLDTRRNLLLVKLVAPWSCSPSRGGLNVFIFRCNCNLYLIWVSGWCTKRKRVPHQGFFFFFCWYSLGILDCYAVCWKMKIMWTKQINDLFMLLDLLFVSVKVCEKQLIIREKKVQQITREKEVMNILNNKWNPKAPFFVKLSYAFQGEFKLCILLHNVIVRIFLDLVFNFVYVISL